MSTMPHGGPRRRWTDEEFDRLFKTYPPDGPKPSRADFQRVADELDRSFDAVDWMWADARAMVDGRQGTGSERLYDYLQRRGMIDPREP